jgi:hypothetical protein
MTMNSKFRKILFAVIGGFFLGWCLMWVANSHGGEYVTYTDPKTGIKYYGDALPPSAPSNVRIEVRQHEGVSTVGNNWTASERSKTEQLSVATQKSIPKVSQPQYSGLPGVDPLYEHVMYNASKPFPPTRGRVASQFNALTNAHERYESEMLDWRMKGHDLGYGYKPTGFSKEERQYYESIGSFDRAFRRK